MNSVSGKSQPVKGREMLKSALNKAQAELLTAVSQEVSELLVQAVTCLLHRLFHQRRAGLARWVEENGRCQRCQSRAVCDFSRNGYRERTLLTPLGWIDFFLPRVRCRCGGSVALDFAGLVRPYQRISDLVDEQIRRWYRLGMSLRQMQQELSTSSIGPLALRTLLQRIQQSAPTLEVAGVPPIVQVDAIWVTQVLPNGGTYYDRKGRKRMSKGRYKRPIFIALGIWPQTNQAQVLEWMLAESEEMEAWEEFLTRLEAAGIRQEKGLRLLIHGGGSGLCGALPLVDFGVPTQRCLFHKMRNIALAIHLPKGLSRPERSARRKAILQRFLAIWQAEDYTSALQCYRQVVRDFRLIQPATVASLRRDFRQTLTFYAFAESYPVHHLRTTSRLERFNRTLRTRQRAACALHSNRVLLP